MAIYSTAYRAMTSKITLLMMKVRAGVNQCLTLITKYSSTIAQMAARIMRRGGACRTDQTHGTGNQLHSTTHREAVHGLGRSYARPYGTGWFWQVRDIFFRGRAPGDDAAARPERAQKDQSSHRS
jgi:hypothetical protein